MGVGYNPKIITDGLVMYLDAANRKSYGRTNLFTHSENFNNAAWTKTNILVTSNAIAGPTVDGVTLTADKIYETAVTGQFLVSQNPYTAVANDVNTISVYAKAGERTVLRIDSAGESPARFDLSTGTVSNAGGHVCSIESIGDGWYRCRATITEVSVVGSQWYFGIFNGATSYAGVAGNGLYIAGAQFERNRTFLGYYIKTVSSVVDGTAWTDLSGNSNNGALTNGPTYDSLNGGSIVLDGLDDYIETFTTNSYFTNGFSMLGWINPLTAGENNVGRIFDKTNNSTASTSGMFLYMATTQSINLQINNGTILGSTNSSVPYSRWTHVVATVDDSGNASIYINGVANNSGTVSLPSTITTAFALRIGNRSNATDRSFNGKIALAKIYNRALSESEVRQNFNALRGRFGI